MCDHRWRKVYEQAVFGGAFQVGWECVKCKNYVSNGSMTPTGLGGIVLDKAARLIGPHGGRGNTSDGAQFKEQIVDENGQLTIVR